MIKTETSLEAVKNTIKRLYGKPVEIELNLGRNKTVKFSGTLSGVYPALFTVAPNEKSFRIRTAYSYSEYMCGKVKIKTVDQNV